MNRIVSVYRSRTNFNLHNAGFVDDVNYDFVREIDEKHRIYIVI